MGYGIIDLGAALSVAKSMADKVTPTISSVLISPTSQTVARGYTQTFTATVNASSYVSQRITWSVEGNLSSNTKIEPSGVLRVAANETAGTLTVRAKSNVIQ